MRQRLPLTIGRVLPLRREIDILRVLADSTPTHLAYFDRNFNFVFVNDAYVKGCGHSRDELLGRNHFDLFPNPENEAIFRRTRDTGETVRFTAKPFEYADQPWRGMTFWDWQLTPVKDGSGDVEGLALSLLDVTEAVRADRRAREKCAQVKALNRRLARKRREAERRAEESRVLLESLTEGVVVVDPRGRIVFINATAAGLLAVPQSDVPRRANELGIRVAVDDELLALTPNLLGRLFIGKSSASGEALVFRADGSERRVAFTRGLVKDPLGKIIAAVITFHDVTDLRRLERAKDEFLQVLAHELRNPLAAAYGLVGISRLRLGRETRVRIGEYLRLAEAEMERLNGLINEIIAGYRVSSGRLPLDLGPTDLVGVIAEAAAPYQHLAHGVKVVVEELPSGGLSVLGDAKRLVEVLSNLLSNAAKYSPPGSTVRIRTGDPVGVGGGEAPRSAPPAPDGKKPCVVLRVEDEGIGIPPDQLEKVFEGFYRASNVTNGQPSGLGLGLYVSRDIVRRHGGDLWAENRPGGGAALCLKLPLLGPEGQAQLHGAPG